jgi:hypothetical protein
MIRYAPSIPCYNLRGVKNIVSAADKLEQRNRELTILNQIAGALNRQVDMTRAL